MSARSGGSGKKSGVDPRLGNLGDFVRLVRDAEQRGIRVIVGPMRSPASPPKIPRRSHDRSSATDRTATWPRPRQVELGPVAELVHILYVFADSDYDPPDGQVLAIEGYGYRWLRGRSNGDGGEPQTSR